MASLKITTYILNDNFGTVIAMDLQQPSPYLSPFSGYSDGEARSSFSRLTGEKRLLLLRFFKTNFLMLFLKKGHKKTKQRETGLYPLQEYILHA